MFGGGTKESTGGGATSTGGGTSKEGGGTSISIPVGGFLIGGGRIGALSAGPELTRGGTKTPEFDFGAGRDLPEGVCGFDGVLGLPGATATFGGGEFIGGGRLVVAGAGLVVAGVELVVLAGEDFVGGGELTTGGAEDV